MNEMVWYNCLLRLKFKIMYSFKIFLQPRLNNISNIKFSSDFSRSGNIVQDWTADVPTHTFISMRPWKSARARRQPTPPTCISVKPLPLPLPLRHVCRPHVCFAADCLRPVKMCAVGITTHAWARTVQNLGFGVEIAIPVMIGAVEDVTWRNTFLK